MLLFELHGKCIVFKAIKAQNQCDSSEVDVVQYIFLNIEIKRLFSHFIDQLEIYYSLIYCLCTNWYFFSLVCITRLNCSIFIFFNFCLYLIRIFKALMTN